MIETISTGLTLVRNFKWLGPWFAVISIASLLLGGGVTSCVTKKVMDGRVARAELALSEYKLEVSKAVTDAAAKAEEAGRAALEARNHDREKIDSIATDIRAMRRDVRVCASTSDLQIPGTASGVDATSADGQSRAAEAVLSELAARFAERADDNASKLNRLQQFIDEARQ